jgi:hypothetical protein
MGRCGVNPISARVKAHEEKERGLPCGIGWPIVMRELRYW